jgi:uncharacterized membrane protein YczE
MVLGIVLVAIGIAATVIAGKTGRSRDDIVLWFGLGLAAICGLAAITH